jgi:hypothetical protein
MAEELIVGNDGQIKVVGTTINPGFVTDEYETDNNIYSSKNHKNTESIELNNNRKNFF